jgi:AraC-like DNA-binding protein
VLPITTARFALPLGTWTFSECRPAALSGAVESIWEVEGVVVNPRERIFPSAYVEIIVNLGPPQRIVDGSDACGTFGDGSACVSGLQQRPLIVETALQTHVFGIRLHATAAQALLASEMTALSGRVVDLRDILHPAHPMIDRFATAGTFEERAVLVCRWLEASLARSLWRGSYVRWIAANIERTGGRAAIEPLRRRAGVSKTKLATDFRKYIGSTPKVFARLVRFGRARGLLQERTGSFAGVAAAAGYYDQAHMALDFRDFAGLTPTEFLACCYPDGNSAVETFFQDAERNDP